MLCPNQCNEKVSTKFINLKTNMCLEQTTSFIIWRKAPPIKRLGLDGVILSVPDCMKTLI
jgi:hypothetical protein